MNRGERARRAAARGRRMRSERVRPQAAAALAALVAIALALAACGGSGDDGGTGTGTSSTDAGAKRGGTLTIANPSFPPSLDPAMGQPAYGDYYNLAYDPLIVLAPDGSFKPGLALRWGYGPRNMSFTIELRPGVTFSDGEPLDAAAVKTWIEHALRLPGGAAPGYLGTLESIDVEGPLRLTLRFRSPTPLLEQVLSQKLQIGMIGSPKAVKARTLATQTAGAGPYVLDRGATVARDSYVYVPNPRYWNKDAVHWDKVVIKTISNPSAALQALKTGQVQVAKDQPVTGLDAAKAAGLRFVAPVTLIMGVSFLDRDGRLVKPLGDVRVRQALNYAVDREAINRVIGAGYGEVTDQLAVEGDDSFDEALAERYPYDPGKARALLAEAGYGDGFTLRLLSLNIVGQDQVAQTVAGQLAKIGVTVKPDIKTNFGDYTGGIASKAFPAVTLSWGRLPAVTDYQLLWGPNATGSNSFGSQSDELDAIYERLVAAPPEEADAIAREMQRFLVEQAWFLPISGNPLVVLHRPEVAGVDVTPRRNVVYTNEFRPAG